MKNFQYAVFSVALIGINITYPLWKLSTKTAGQLGTKKTAHVLPKNRWSLKQPCPITQKRSLSGFSSWQLPGWLTPQPTGLTSQTLSVPTASQSQSSDFKESPVLDSKKKYDKVAESFRAALDKLKEAKETHDIIATCYRAALDELEHALQNKKSSQKIQEAEDMVNNMYTKYRTANANLSIAKQEFTRAEDSLKSAKIEYIIAMAREAVEEAKKP